MLRVKVATGPGDEYTSRLTLLLAVERPVRLSLLAMAATLVGFGRVAAGLPGLEGPPWRSEENSRTTRWALAIMCSEPWHLVGRPWLTSLASGVSQGTKLTEWLRRTTPGWLQPPQVVGRCPGTLRFWPRSEKVVESPLAHDAQAQMACCQCLASLFLGAEWHVAAR